MARLQKTNAARLLDRLGLPYRLVTYACDPTDLSASALARTVGVAPEMVYKTLLLKGDRSGPLVCVIGAEREVDLKKAAVLSGNKSVMLSPLSDLTALTGYIRGGCSPLAMKKKYPTYLDRPILDQDQVLVSAGLRGCQLALAPGDLVAACGGVVGDIGKDPS